MQLEPSFRRIAESLEVFELTREADSDDAVDLDDLGRGSHKFLNFYSEDGIRNAIAAYGLDERLREAGLSDYDLAVTCEDPYRHRLQVFVAGKQDYDHTVMDLRIHLCTVTILGEREGWLERITNREDAPDDTSGEALTRHDALVVDWLTLQNPRGEFTSARPRLPGQKHPGTGLGRAIHNLLMIMAWRVGRQALVQTPANFHLAVLYHRAGYRFASDARNRQLEEVTHALRSLHFAAAAWAVESGAVTGEDGAVYKYKPAEMILPLSPGLKQSLMDVGDTIRRVMAWGAPPRFDIDEDALRQYLREHPVDGLNPDDIQRGWF